MTFAVVIETMTVSLPSGGDDILTIGIGGDISEFEGSEFGLKYNETHRVPINKLPTDWLVINDSEAGESFKVPLRCIGDFSIFGIMGALEDKLPVVSTLSPTLVLEVARAIEDIQEACIVEDSR